jgi:hypothetical protein
VFKSQAEEILGARFVSSDEAQPGPADIAEAALDAQARAQRAAAAAAAKAQTMGGLALEQRGFEGLREVLAQEMHQRAQQAAQAGSGAGGDDPLDKHPDEVLRDLLLARERAGGGVVWRKDPAVEWVRDKGAAYSGPDLAASGSGSGSGPGDSQVIETKEDAALLQARIQALADRQAAASEAAAANARAARGMLFADLDTRDERDRRGNEHLLF